MLNDPALSLPSQCSPHPDLLCCGMPSDTDLKNIADKGIKTIVNLCPIEETPPNEMALVESLGMSYVNIPVRGPQDLNMSNATALASVLDDTARHPVLIHCRSANRVGALLTLKSFWIDKKSEAESLAVGRAGGLTALEPAVIQLIRQ